MMVVYAMATDAVVFGILVDGLPALLLAEAGFDPRNIIPSLSRTCPPTTPVLSIRFARHWLGQVALRLVPVACDRWWNGICFDNDVNDAWLTAVQSMMDSLP